jgi:hypothetical protein
MYRVLAWYNLRHTSVGGSISEPRDEEGYTMKNEELIKKIDEQVAHVSWLDTADLEGELDARFHGAKGDQVAEWIRDFSLRQLRRLREWANDQKD